jgi:segregation and condensation protein A
MDLVQLVAQPTWREFLVELVSTQQMDPWDINLNELADAYLAKVRELQSLDLRVPANVILASAILLYFKAQALRLEDDAPYDALAEETPVLLQENIPDLVYRENRPRTRRVTLEELLTTLDKVLKEGPRKLMNAASPKALAIELPPESMEERMARVLSLAGDLRDSENVVLFSALVNKVMSEPRPQRVLAHDGGEPAAPEPAQAAPEAWTAAEAVVYCLLPVLHLSQEERVHAWQDETFGEIFLKLN